MAENIKKIVPDTSIIIEAVLSKKIESGEISPDELIIHQAVLSELEHQANLNKAIGFLGLTEIKKLRTLLGERLKFSGSRPKLSEIKYASLGEIDALIRQLAYDEGATLITSDKVQRSVAEAMGLENIFVKPEGAIKKLKLEAFFDETTMSVHLRENVVPYAKKGKPGEWIFVALREKTLTQEEIQDISREIIEECKIRKDGFIEIERPGSTIVQLGMYRIVITKPPFSDGWEITAVRPVRTLELEDYKLSEKLLQRIGDQAEGILIAGAPGMGKSTFAQALAVYYSKKEKIVKTVEAPRDLVLPETITQYAISHGDAQEVHDILLLSRPDYTIYDEMRNTEDFKLFADLRLAGVGMVGVVHATNPIDAIQRFIGRVEMGVIPQIIDTVVFIKNGFINRVLSLSMTVKVPSGMTEADLARPCVVVNDFETGKLEYEIYSYGEQTVVIPVSATEGAGEITGVRKLAKERIEKEFMRFTDRAEVECVSDHKCIVKVPERDIAKIIGKQGKTISEIEDALGMSIDIQELGEGSKASSKVVDEKGNELTFDIGEKKKNLLIDLGIKNAHKDVDIHVSNQFFMSAKAGATGLIKIKKNNKIGSYFSQAIKEGDEIKIYG